MTSIERAREAVHRCRLLAGCTESPGVITRPPLSEAMRGAHRQLGEWMARAGLAVRVDAAGNLRGARPPAPALEERAPRLFLGSHLDTVPNAGAFDGVLGVSIALAVVESLGDRRLPFGVDVIAFSDEEGVRFGVPFVGSRAFAGTAGEDLLDRRDAGGRALRDAIADFGLDPREVAGARAPRNALGYLECHIEQGPELDRLDLPLAIVDAIAGQTRASVTFEGQAGHAGTTPMAGRRDALAGGAEWITRVERDAAAGVVATVGRVRVTPGASNVIPNRCELSLDVRHAGDAVRTAAVDRLQAAAREIAARRGLSVEWSIEIDQPTVPMDGALTARLERAVARAGRPVRRMSSGAGHDAAVVASVMPVAMLFLRCDRGISHNPAESVRDEDVAAAIEAAAMFVDETARTFDGAVN